MPRLTNPHLYGISSENSDRADANLWGKNQFNSVFPLSLCLYMRDNDISPVAVQLTGGEIQVNDTLWSMADVVGNSTANPYFSFETTFEPYRGYSQNEVDKIDLVVSIADTQTRPLEIKRTEFFP